MLLPSSSVRYQLSKIVDEKRFLVRASNKNMFHPFLLAKTDGDDGNDMEKKLFLVLISKETEVCNNKLGDPNFKY